MSSFLFILLIFSKLIVVKFLQELFFEISRMFPFRYWKNPESLVDKKNMKSEYFLPGFHRAAAAAAAVKSDANGIFHVAASEMNWIGRLSQIVKLILTGWGCWHSSWLLLTHTHNHKRQQVHLSRFVLLFTQKQTDMSAHTFLTLSRLWAFASCVLRAQPE